MFLWLIEEPSFLQEYQVTSVTGPKKIINFGSSLAIIYSPKNDKFDKINVGLRWQILIVNMGRSPVASLWMLTVYISATQIKEKVTMNGKDTKGKTGQEKTTKCYPILFILKAVRCKEDIGNSWSKSENNPLNLMQQANHARFILKRGWFYDFEIL